MITLIPVPTRGLADCEREPIHVPGQIQPHGFLLAAPGIDAPISHASENARTRAGDGSAVLGRTWTEALGEEAAAALRRAWTETHSHTRPFSVVAAWYPAEGASPLELIAHVRDGFLIVEAEELVADGDLSATALGHELAPLLARLGEAETVGQLCALVTDEARRLTNFDRVLVYQFDEEWNGTVIAESRNDTLPAYLGHRFPAADIPRQARELYHINRLRLIADADYQPVRLYAASAALPPLDLTLATLRGISPIHLEYMRNMGTGSSMSASIMRGDKLWGLLSCHGRAPRRLSFATRSVCDLLGQIFSLQLAGREQANLLARQVELRHVLAELLTRMTDAADFATALAAPELLRLTDAHGAALVRGSEVFAFGSTPAEATLLALRDWVAPLCADGVFQTHQLPSLRPDLPDATPLAAGLLAVSISPVEKCYALWFRAELVQTVVWGGNPHKSAEPLAEAVRIHPRKSFDAWQETVRGRAQPWGAAEQESALAFRRAIIDIVLKQATAKATLLTEVQRANKELEAFTYTVSHDLRAPFRHVDSYAELLHEEKGDQLDEEGRLLLQKILKAAAYAGELVDTMLAFSRMNLMPIVKEDVDLGQIVAQARSHVAISVETRSVDWRIGPLPVVQADSRLLLPVMQNLLENALKYTAHREHTVIEVEARKEEAFWVISVRDNGVGFDMRHANKLFGVFQRLHDQSQFPGLGIGLATVRRIIERHGGTAWAEGRPDEGATFFFSLPTFSPYAQAHPAG